MSDIGTTSQVGGAGAYARAAMLGPAIPVRSIDPTRQRFQVGPEAEQAQNQQSVALAPTDQSDEQPAFTGGSGDAAARNPRGGFGLLGAFTSFLARMFAQPEVESTAPTASVQAGIQAYTRTAGPLPANENGVEVVSPSFPRLSSGRAVDLTV